MREHKWVTGGARQELRHVMEVLRLIPRLRVDRSSEPAKGERIAGGRGEKRG